MIVVLVFFVFANKEVQLNCEPNYGIYAYLIRFVSVLHDPLVSTCKVNKEF